MPVTTRSRRLCLPVAALLGAVALSGCGGGTGSGAASSAAPAADSAGSPQLTIKDFTFRPATLKVKAGQKIKVTNKDNTAHTVTAKNKSFDTHDIAPGKSVTFTAPSKKGKYPYTCTIHPNMKGTLTVG
ncbi:cupredoxin domain-containing protein [Streptomyces sp. NPDC059740]|uniref:cupredoxin domain-containing protein n=1 Tax=Streptomyces sp. NPDC059740 TaxID=3346926 RepID=UPI003659EBC8